MGTLCQFLLMDYQERFRCRHLSDEFSVLELSRGGFWVAWAFGCMLVRN